MKNAKIKNKIIEYLISEYNKSDTNIIKIYLNDINKMGLSQNEFSRIICVLNSSNLIDVTMSYENSFISFWKIKILLPCIEYFDNQKANRNKFLIPILISTIGAIASMLTAYFTALAVIR